MEDPTVIACSTPVEEARTRGTVLLRETLLALGSPPAGSTGPEEERTAGVAGSAEERTAGMAGSTEERTADRAGPEEDRTTPAPEEAAAITAPAGAARTLGPATDMGAAPAPASGAPPPRVLSEGSTVNVSDTVIFNIVPKLESGAACRPLCGCWWGANPAR